jgi:hypothetical protein
MNKLVAALALIAALFLAAYGGSPYWAVQQLREAARTGDQEKLEAHVDFPAVRDSIKSQLNAAIAERVQAEGDAENNPFAVLGAMLAPAIVEQAVNAYVTPDAIAKMVKDGEAPTGADAVAPEEESAKEEDKAKLSYAYSSLDRFKATVTSEDQPDEPLVMTMERRGMFGWKLVRIDLPLEEKEPAKPEAAPAAQP